MGRIDKPILLVGGVPGNTADEVFRLCGHELGHAVPALPDGEIGERRYWVLYESHYIYEKHPDLEITRATKGNIPNMPAWLPTGYDDLTLFRVKGGKDKIRFDNLGYADMAEKSYADLRALRDRGFIPESVRFQVCLPYPEDACRLFAASRRDAEIMIEAYQEALVRDVRKMLTKIPAKDLMIQWDINWEVIAVEVNDCADEDPLAFPLDGKPFERYERYTNALSKDIPEDVLLGLHLCYGDYRHRHFLEPKDLGTCVRMANAGIAAAGRKIDFLHMPVPRGRHDDAYFAPLQDLKAGEATLYIGLVHYTDGIPGTAKRLETFKRHYRGAFGIATECGLGRRPADQSLAQLLRIHREVAKGL